MEHTQEAPRTNRTKGEGSIYQKTNGIWMYSVMHQGKRLSKSLGTRDFDEAQKEYIKAKNRFGGQIDRGELDPTSVKNFTIGQLLSSYLTEMETNGRKSVDIIRLVIGKIKKSKEFSPGRKVAALTTMDFKNYRAREVASGVSHSTVNYRFALIRAAMNLETKQTPSCVGKVPYIPIVHVDNAREGFLEYDDHTSVRDALPASLKALFIVAFHSGCRLGEVLNMKWSDVDWRNRVIRLPKTKNGTKRNLPFWGSIEETMKMQKKIRDANHPKCEALFFWIAEDCGLSHGGVRNAPGSAIKDFRASWTAAVKQAHEENKNVMEGLLFHDLRRSGVRVMVQEAGIPESQAMLISGHKTRAMLERYNIVSLKNVQDAGAKLDAWSKNRAAEVGSKSSATQSQEATA